jgi:hypothetical protein
MGRPSYTFPEKISLGKNNLIYIDIGIKVNISRRIAFAVVNKSGFRT